MSNPPPTATTASKRARSAATGAIDSRAAAFQFLAALAKELSERSVNLPCFPNIVLRVRQALSDPKSTPEKTVVVVGAEPRLAARLLQTANSAVFNPTGKPVTDLRTAVTRLGHRLVQSATMSFAVRQMKEDRALSAIATPLGALWETSIAVASICQLVARRSKVRPEEAFLTGLLHGIGRLYIMVRAAADQSRGVSYGSLVQYVGDWHPSIGKAVLENWGFVEEMAEAVGSQCDHEPRTRHDANLTDVLIVGIVLADALQRSDKRDLSRCAEIPAFKMLALSSKECITYLKLAQQQLTSLHSVLGC